MFNCGFTFSDCLLLVNFRTEMDENIMWYDHSGTFEYCELCNPLKPTLPRWELWWDISALISFGHQAIWCCLGVLLRTPFWMINNVFLWVCIILFHFTWQMPKPWRFSEPDGTEVSHIQRIVTYSLLNTLFSLNIWCFEQIPVLELSMQDQGKIQAWPK